ncbi:cellulose biosynthesis cyclic di-GMP-binding regulatory protein BcsB [Methylobacterium sp. WL1]|uniref:cellulose biosynthesis cyclic di-GMP-binding regulatory protein BcsB n=1 Tax=Methylobacterium sp. WL1 TaxID=2603276 RepID=UPI001FEFB92A|nr:cellulose biosynthesis cyclic di-GMP-binding regulatory protein BcsB [Methylobacterium sp. WL1]
MGVRLGLSALVLLLALAGHPALAQSFLGRGPAERLTVPPSGNALRAPTEDGTAPARSPDAPAAEQRPAVPRAAEPPRASAPQAVPRGVIQSTIAPARRLPSGPRGFRLTGEEDSLRYPVYLTDAQTRGPARLRLSYLSAISVAPESSELAAFVNGTKVGWTRIQAPGAVKVVEFAIGEGVLKPGYNAVTFTASQRHRVDCSTAATYELWTQIDPSRSGLVVGTATDMDVRSLAAAEPDESGALPIQVILNERPNLARLERMIEAVQALALVGRVARPTVTFGPPLQGRNGINLVVGTASEIGGIEGVSDLGPITGPRLAMLPTRPNVPPTLVVTGSREEDVRQAIANLAVSAETGTPGGLKAVQLFRGYMVYGGENLTLDRLGAASREFSGRLLHVGFDLRFPGDFVPADYGKAMLHLAGAYVAGLSSEARIVIDINGRNAASIPLPDARGEVFDDSAIPLPFSLWRPGVNHVEISAQLPNAADQTCDTLSPAAKQARYLFLDRSRIEIPHFARAARSPDLAAIKGGAVPFVVPGQRPRLVLPTPDRDSADAAATLAARLAMASERVIDFEVVTQQQVAFDASQLVVAPARALDPALLEAVGFDPQQIQRVWEGRADMVATPGQFGPEGVLTLDRLRRNLPMRCALPTLISQVRQAQPGPDPADPDTAGPVPAPGRGGRRPVPDLRALLRPRPHRSLGSLDARLAPDLVGPGRRLERDHRHGAIPAPDGDGADANGRCGRGPGHGLAADRRGAAGPVEQHRDRHGAERVAAEGIRFLPRRSRGLGPAGRQRRLSRCLDRRARDVPARADRDRRDAAALPGEPAPRLRGLAVDQPGILRRHDPRHGPLPRPRHHESRAQRR